jgi:predicted phosphodiesterase
MPASATAPSARSTSTSGDPAERRERRGHALGTLRRAAALLAIVVATLAGGYLALVSFRQDRDLSVGTMRLSVSPGHKGALDVYVPLVDWGARFEAIRLPARLRVDVRTVDRDVVKKVAAGGELDVRLVRKQARDEIAVYLRNLILVVLLCGGSLGVLVAFAVRGGATPQLRYTVGTALATAVLTAVALIVLLPPRGEIDTPQYYAFGPDIPRALEAVETAQRSTRNLDQELDAQLVGLARLVTAPANRPAIEDRPRITIASDLHNNVLALPILERTANRGPLFFPGDLTDRGSPFENALVRRVVRTGRPFVFVAGNHDSDTLIHQLARDGAMVLTRTGRLNPDTDTTTGHPIVTIAGLRVAGYDDPFLRQSDANFADRYTATPDPSEVRRFATWLRPIRDDVDIVMVHNPVLLTDALEELDARPPARGPLIVLTGHTHHAELIRRRGATVINAGTVGAGGTGNLLENSKLGIARLAYEKAPFEPLAVDMVTIDPRTGSATARRVRLDEPPD